MDITAGAKPLDLVDFADRRGERFSLDVGSERAVEAILAEVSQGAATSPGNQQFSLLFRAPIDAPLEQRIYTVAHAELGRFDLFLVPVARDAAGVQYEAVFNHLASAVGAA